MKKKVNEIANKSEKELKDLLVEKREELNKFLIDNKQNKLKNTSSIFNIRKEIARILTLVKEKEFAASKTAVESK